MQLMPGLLACIDRCTLDDRASFTMTAQSPSRSDSAIKSIDKEDGSLSEIISEEIQVPSKDQIDSLIRYITHSSYLH